MLIELQKVNAPSLLLSEFNYYFNKAINLYINKRYNIYDINQQTTDDIRVLKSTTVLTPQPAYKNNPSDAISTLSSSYPKIANLQGATYEVNLPEDYLHLLNCVCVFYVTKNWKCYDGGSYVYFPAKRLTADSWSTIISDYYNRPTPERPYYYIHNVNIQNNIPTNPLTFTDGKPNNGTDMFGKYGVSKTGEEGIGGIYNAEENEGSNFPRVILLDNSNMTISTVEKEATYRYGNPSKVRMEIRYGKDDSVFVLKEVAVDYIKSPLHIRLTQELMDLTEDTSQIMEFPDYVCQEIINELTLLVMARVGDPALQSFPQVTLSIANPAQALTQQPALTLA